MDTRMNLLTIIDYKEFYGVEKKLENAAGLLEGIPSITLVNYLSGFSANLYLNENSDEARTVQVHLINSLIANRKNKGK